MPKLNVNEKPSTTPKFKLIPAPKITFNSFVDCNMAEVWIGDTFRIKLQDAEDRENLCLKFC